MKFKINKTNYFAIITLCISILILLATGMTFAWFTDSQEAEATLTFGKIDLIANKSTDFTSISNTVMPGQVLMSSDIACSVAQNSSNLYARAKIVITTTSTDETVKSWINNTLMPSIYTSGNIYSAGTDYQWINGNDGFYYLHDKASTPAPKAVSYVSANNPTYIFVKNGLTIPLSVEPAENNAQYGASINIRIVFQAIQSANLPSSTLTGVQGSFATVFGWPIIVNSTGAGTVSLLTSVNGTTYTNLVGDFVLANRYLKVVLTPNEGTSVSALTDN